LKVAVVTDGETATDAGIVRRVELLDNMTESPPAGLVPFTVTVQVLLAPEFSDVGAHTREATVPGGARLREAVLELPLNAAVTTAV
jgi:hypothetical protein